MSPARPWSRAAAAAAVQEVLSGAGGVIGRALLLEATPAPGGVLVTFRWRQDPTVYGYLAHDSDPPDWAWDPEAPTSRERAWAEHFAWRLKENLDTGGVRWAPRRTRSEPVMLDLDSPPTERGRYYIGTVRTEAIAPETHVIVVGGGPVPEFEPSRAGHWLEAAGLHVDRARASLLGGRLLCWLQAYTDEARPRLVGHAAASWAGERLAVLDTLETLAGIDEEPALLSRLFWQVVYEATEQGADRLDVTVAPRQLLDPLGAPVEAGRSVLPLPPPAEVDPRYR